MTSAVFAIQLQKHGIEISPTRVRQLWGTGFSKAVKPFVARYRKEIEHGTRGDPALRAARMELIQEQTRLTRVRREREELESRYRSGQLVERSEVRKTMEQIYSIGRRTFEVALLNDIPGRCDGADSRTLEAELKKAFKRYSEIICDEKTYAEGVPVTS
jgi:phage terminase Nu1 subunit (DNA packaging protein)